MSSSLDHKCQRCGSQYHGQICPFCTITGLDVNALLAAEGLTMPQGQPTSSSESCPPGQSQVTLVDVVSNRSFPVNAPVCRFGRDISNDIVLTGDKSLSRFHFQITLLNSEYFVEDAGSRNGTFLNGSPVTAPRKVLNGDIISAGMTRYRFVLGDDEGSFSGSDSIEGLADAISSEYSAATNGDQAATVPPPPPMPAEEHASAAEQTSSAPSQSVDPLTRLFQEGQALMSSSNGGSEAETNLDEFFAEKSGNGGNGASKPTDNFMQLEKPKETPVDELFQEQLRAISAANEAKPAEAEAEAEADAEAAVDKPAPPSLPDVVHTKEMDFGAERPPKSRDLEKITEAIAKPIPSHAPAASTQTTVEHSAVACATVAEPDTCQAPEAEDDSRWPQWVRDYKLPELETVQNRIDILQTEIAERQRELQELAVSVNSAQSIKNRLLAARDGELHEAVKAVLDTLQWQTAPNGGSANEIVVSSDGRATAIIRVVCTESQPKPNELASLVSSLSTFWCDHGVEPKGILLVSFITSDSVSDRPNLSEDYASYAAKKHVCVMSTTQLLSIYREASLRHADVESIKSAILDTSGHLAGYNSDDDSGST